MTDIDYIVDDIRDAVGMVVSDAQKVDDIVDKVRALITPELDKRQDESERHEAHAGNCEDTIEDLETKLGEAQEEAEELELDQEWLSMVNMFRRAGGHVQDVRYGITPTY